MHYETQFCRGHYRRERAQYAIRLLEVLLAAGCNVHLSISAVAQVVLRHDLDLTVDLDNFSPAMLRLDTGPPFRDPKLQSLRRTPSVPAT